MEQNSEWFELGLSLLVGIPMFIVIGWLGVRFVMGVYTFFAPF